MKQNYKDSLISQLNGVINACSEFYSDTSPAKNNTIELQKLLSMAQAAINRAGVLDPPHLKNAEEILALTTPADSYKLDKLMGIMQSLRFSIQNGYVEGMKELIHGEVFEDFLEMAQHLFEEGYKDPAAVIVGASLESHLRNLSLKNGIATFISTPKGDRPKKADRMNAELSKAGCYSKLDMKSVTAWLDLRNKAAHGNFDQYTIEQVGLMISGVRNFIARNPA